MTQNTQPSKVELFQKTIEASPEDYLIGLLAELREGGEDYMVEPIIGLLFSNRSERIKNEVVSLLVDLKNPSAVPIIVQKLEENKNSKDIHRLISVCWQSRLNFSSHTNLLMDFVVNGDYQSCLEAFTAIENMMDSLSEETINQLKHRAEQSLGKATETKPLIEELISMLSGK